MISPEHIEDVEEHTSIADAARRLGVPMPTLRSWERRYGIPTTPRSLGSHRRYTAADLHAIRLMRDEIGRGQRAGLAAQSVRALLGVQGPARAHIDALLSASEAVDSDRLRAELNGAAGALGLAGCLDEVVFPAMKQIGLWWHAGHCDIEQERLTSETVRAWLEAQAARAPAPRPGSPVVLACAPGDQHTIGLEALGLLLRHQQQACRVLGARIPVPALTTAVQATQAPATVVVCHLNSGRQRAIRALRAVQELGTETFYAGNAFSTPRSRRNVPGRYLGSRLRDACAVIVASIEA
ncbi:MAG: MerR family transcriptional regulator [Jatrophihabitantaceae bacterium]